MVRRKAGRNLNGLGLISWVISINDTLEVCDRLGQCLFFESNAVKFDFLGFVFGLNLFVRCVFDNFIHIAFPFVEAMKSSNLLRPIYHSVVTTVLKSALYVLECQQNKFSLQFCPD